MAKPIVPGSGRPSPPTNMTKEQAAVWRELVNSQFDHWFRTSLDLLHLLCVHTVTTRNLIAARTEAEQRKDWMEMQRLGLMLEKEGQLVARYSGVLRLTPRNKTEWAANHVQKPQPTVNCKIVALFCRAVNRRRAFSYKRASPLPA